MTNQDIFDDVAFACLKEFRQYVAGRGGKVVLEFARPLRRVDDPISSYSTVVGSTVTLYDNPMQYRIAVTLAFFLDEIPRGSRDKRSLFKSQLLRVKKQLMKQYRELETRVDGKAQEGLERVRGVPDVGQGKVSPVLLSDSHEVRSEP
jgi:hypothetical protein